MRREARGPQIFLSRTHPQFTAKLFTQEVPEIYDGIVEVKAVARDPGSRAKIAVISNDSSIDPVGACVGMRGSRVQAVVNELQGEKIDIIPWSPDAATFIVNALQPAEVMKVVLDEDSTRIEVVVPDDQLSLAIGRRGQNVRLASQLTGWDIDILTEAEESERRQKEFAERTHMFMNALDVDETVAQLLASEGFRTVEEIAYVEPHELAGIEGFDDDTAGELQARAQGHLARIEAELDDTRKALGVADELKEIEGLTTPMLVKLGENEVKTRRGSRRLRDRRSRRLDREARRRREEVHRLSQRFRTFAREADAIVMAARVHAGWIEAAGAAPRRRKAERSGEEAEAEETRIASDARERRRAGRERTCVVTGFEGRAGGDAALCAVAAKAWSRRTSCASCRAAASGRGSIATSCARRRRNRRFARGFRKPAKAEPGLADQVDRLLEQDALRFLSLVNKAGLVVTGAAKVEAAIRAGAACRRCSTPATARPTAPASSIGCSTACSANGRASVSE